MTTTRRNAGTCILALLAALVALAGAALPPARALAGGPVSTRVVVRIFPVTTRGRYNWAPAISGHIVVWWRWRSNSGLTRGDIYGKSLATGHVFPITTSGTVIGAPAISGHTVVWEDCRSCIVTRDAMGYYITHNVTIYGKNLSTGREYLIARPTSPQPSPTISGQIVIWHDRRNGQDVVYGKDLTHGREFPIANRRCKLGAPAISGTLVVWLDGRTGRPRICGIDVATGQEFTHAISSGRLDTLRGVRFSDPTVIWTNWNSDRANQPASIDGVDLSTGRAFHVTTIPYGHFNPQLGPATALSGHIVLWTQTPTLVSPIPRFHIYGRDLIGGQIFPVTRNPYDQESPAISGNIVVWQELRGSNWDIYGAELSVPNS